ncbi:MAG: N-acetylmuramoyl-L-alanine amidase [Hyphomicrobium sp.]|nr:MAG: N-acetylmuramoyl-L-alanine amidase [Hyphomicrobium sp.]
MYDGYSRRQPKSGLAFTTLATLLCLPVAAYAQSPAAPSNQVAGSAASTPAPLIEPSLSAGPSATRFVIGLDKSAQFQVFSLSNPNRVIVELPDVRMQLPTQDGDKPAGLVKSFRAGLSAPGKSRIVIDVTMPVIVESAKLEAGKDGKSYRLALEIVRADSVKPGTSRGTRIERPAGLGAAGIQPPLPKPAERPNIRAAKAFKQVIVIDPGHGGHDSGAQKHGTVEKDVVLAFGKTLRDKLESTGRYKILMTRDTDTFVELDDRRAFGEKNNAALFMAIHADYASTKARGATIYSLRERDARDLKRSAKGEVTEKVLSSKEVEKVKAASGDLDAIKSILSDLAVREVDATKDRTSVFTRSVIEEMGASTSMRDDPDKQAAFRVLQTAQFPSVLIELAYVSNVQDAQNLKSDSWRDKVADSIVTAVDNYFSHQLARLPM